MLDRQVGLQYFLCRHPKPESDSQAFGGGFCSEHLCHGFIHRFDLAVVQAHYILLDINLPHPALSQWERVL